MQAIVVTGFRIEEYAMIRYMLDAIQASHVKVIIADEQMLYSTQDLAIHSEEIDWEQPRPQEWAQGGAWGSQRVCMFSGLSIAQQVRATSLFKFNQ
jgi:hypothetical protein